MNENIKVSVVVCTYNGEKHLAEQLDSILQSTYPVYEIIGQDDQSTDGTMDIWNSYVKKFPFIKAFVKSTKTSISDNFIEGFSRCTGDYIAWSDQDDIWEADKIEKQLAAMGGKYNLCSHLSPTFVGKLDREHIVYDKRMPNHNLLRHSILSQAPGHTLVVKREFFQKVFDTISAACRKQILSLMYFDALLGTIAIAENQFVYINEPLTWHRCWEKSVTNSDKNGKKMYERSYGNILKQVKRSLNLERRRQAAKYYSLRFKAIMDVLNEMHIPADFSKGTQDCIVFLETFIKHHGMSLKQCWLMIKHRQEIFYTKEKNEFVAICRAIIFVITMYDYYVDSSEKDGKYTR